jgi:hypothetical protein
MRILHVKLEDNDTTVFDKSFALPDDLDNLDQIDDAVEEFKNQALPQIEKQLLAQAQQRAAAELKKTVRDP